MTTIRRLHFPTSNAYLLTGKKSILVDSGSFMNFRALENMLRGCGVAWTEIALLVVTHAHFDHAGTAAKIKAAANCPVAVHALEKDLLESGKNAPMVPIHPLAVMMNPFMNLPFSACRADIALREEFDLNPYGVDAQVMFTPGHTPGSVSVVTAEGDAIVGDLIGGGALLGAFRPTQPRYHYWAASMADVNASLQKLFARKVNTIYVGHGGPLDGEEARAFFAKRIVL